MTLVKIADQWFSLTITEHHHRWTVHASRGDTGDRFGPAFTAPTEASAVAALTAWIEWQSEHASALEVLQHAERAYHRSVTAGAFGSPDDEPAAREGRTVALRALDRARLQLDAVRARQPAPLSVASADSKE